MLKARIPIIKSFLNKVSCYQLFHSYFKWSLHIYKDLLLLCTNMFLKGISYAAKQSFIIFFLEKKNDASKTWKNKDVLCGRMFYFCS